MLGIAWLNPRAMSYLGLNLMLNLGIPTALATVAQMFVITVNDLDLSIGTFRQLCRLCGSNLAARCASPGCCRTSGRRRCLCAHGRSHLSA